MLDARMRYEAERAFTQAHRRAFLQRVWRLLNKQVPNNLLSFDAVREKLKIRGQHHVGVRIIPVDKIVGSVGRYQEFNRAFLPAQDFIRERWKRVYEAAHTAGFPPIDVYKIGDVYFVRDGHHRVSVLKELGAPVVEAYVIEFDTRVPLTPDVVEADLSLKGEYASFLLETELDLIRPEQRIEFSVPGQYRKLQEHIAVHAYFTSLRENRDIPYKEAAARWYDEVYWPMVAIIRETKVLDQFPGRTEADLYLWLIEHRHYLNEELGREVSFEEATADFAREFTKRAQKRRIQGEAEKARAAERRRTKDGT